MLVYQRVNLHFSYGFPMVFESSFPGQSTHIQPWIFWFSGQRVAKTSPGCPWELCCCWRLAFSKRDGHPPFYHVVVLYTYMYTYILCIYYVYIIYMLCVYYVYIMYILCILYIYIYMYILYIYTCIHICVDIHYYYCYYYYSHYSHYYIHKNLLLLFVLSWILFMIVG